MTFNPQLIKVFAERLELGEDDILIPEQPEIMIAYGAALSLDSLYKSEMTTYTADELIEKVGEVESMKIQTDSRDDKRFFESDAEREEFKKRHAQGSREWKQFKKGDVVRAYLGIDSGSTTTKFVLSTKMKIF